jgi:hypothetical protein
LNSVVARAADKRIPHLTVRCTVIPASAGARIDGRFASAAAMCRRHADVRS